MHRDSIDSEMHQQQQQMMMCSGFDGYVRIHRHSGKLVGPILQERSILAEPGNYATFETAWQHFLGNYQKQHCFFFFSSSSSFVNLSETFQTFLQHEHFSKTTPTILENYHLEYIPNPDSAQSSYCYNPAMYDYIFFMRSHGNGNDDLVVGPVAIDSDLLTTLRLVVDEEAEPWQGVFNDLQGLVAFHRCAERMCGLCRAIFVLVATVGYYKLFCSRHVVLVAADESWRAWLVQQLVPYSIMVWAAFVFLETFRSKVQEGFSVFVTERLVTLYQEHNIHSETTWGKTPVEIMNVSSLDTIHCKI